MQNNQNNRARRSVGIAIAAVTVIAMLCFVFGNSMLSKQESAEVSSTVMELVRGLLRPIVEWITGGAVDDALLHKVVRKGAHFAEFAALSFFLTCLLRLLCCTWRTHAMGYVLFFSLLIGVLDEFLQSFTGRGSSVRDVVLDFSGALIGILCAIVVIEIYDWIRWRRK
jgi:VanZ family protein